MNMHHLTGFDLHSLVNDYGITVNFTKPYHDMIHELYIAIDKVDKPFDVYLVQLGQRILCEIFNAHSDVFAKLDFEKGFQYLLINGKRYHTLYSYFINDALYNKDIYQVIGCIKDGKILVNYKLNAKGEVDYIFV